MHDKSRIAGPVLGLVLALAVGARAEDRGDLPFAEGPFKPTLQSLEQYRCPEWFRDAKFGIWAHWGPQAVPLSLPPYAEEAAVGAARMATLGTGIDASHE